MKNINISGVHLAMAEDLKKKNKYSKVEDYLEELIQIEYNKKK